MRMDTSFSSFLEPGIDRVAFISNWLSINSIPFHVVNFSGKQHIIVKFANDHYDPRFRQKILVAHHDRAPNTPGANDNSAACFQLLLFSRELHQKSIFGGQSFTHNIRVLFTDGEEAAGTKGIHGQGSYLLGKGLKQLGKIDEDLYVFDATGTGDTLILSTTGINDKKGNPLNSRLLELHDRAIETAQSVSPENWIRLSTPFSDNAGFLAAGIPSQVITVLPHEEATVLLLALTTGSEKKIDLLTKQLTLNSLQNAPDIPEGIPKTWLRLHTRSDIENKLTKEAFTLIHRFLVETARRHDPISI